MFLSIPAFHVSDTSRVVGSCQVAIASRKSAPLSNGTFDVRIDVKFLPGDAYPTGNVFLNVSMNDGLNGSYRSSTIDLVNSHGKVTPTVFVTGRCTVDAPKAPSGLRFWLMIARNKGPEGPGTPDIVGFAIHDHTGTRVAYGTGPVQPGGDFAIEAE